MTVRRNLIANLGGSAWTGFIALAFIPIYLRAVGAEGYGLVGFFVTLASLMTVFDGGFGAAAARELARVSADTSDDTTGVRDLVRSLELIFWGIAFLLGCAVAAAAPAIALHWLNLEALGHEEALSALRLMGLALALQWPIAYYSGCIVGLQRQIGLNLINSSAVTFRFAGAAVVLSFISPTITAFFAWQAFATLLQVVALRFYLWHNMPGSAAASFSSAALRNVGRFALGVGGINVLGLALTQIDKIILSKILPLEQFGYYTLAATLAAVISRVVMPIFNASYPRLTLLSAAGDAPPLAAFYRSTCALMAFAIAPLSLLLMVFGYEVILFWTGDAELAHRLQWVIALLAAGTLFNGLMTIPYALQLAQGWTSLGLWQNVLAVVVIGPTIWLLSKRFGLVGAASAWVAVNASYVLFSAPIMYSRLLRDEKTHWYLYSVALPIILAFGVMVPIKILFGETVGDPSRLDLFLLLAVSGLSAQVALGLFLRRSLKTKTDLRYSTAK